MAARKANGEGTIYRRADGRYEAATMLPTVDGRRKRLRMYGKTRKEARDKLTAVISRVEQGVLLPERTWKLADFLDFWLEREKRRPLTRRRHESVARLHIKPGLGHHRVDNLSVRVVQAFLDRLLEEDTSVATVHQVRKVLSAALTYAMRQELLFRNVARLVELPPYKPAEAQHWELGETVQFLSAAQSDPLYPAFVLLALYGLRRGEVLGIRWRDVDFGRGVLHIKQQIQRIDGELRQVELKTSSSERDEPLLGTARVLLLQQRENQEAVRTAAEESWQGTGGDDELVFTTQTGRPVESHNLARSFHRICKQHGFRRITIHGLRHSNATAQKDLQVHARDIQAVLGHGDVRTTGIYEHVTLDSKRAALEKVEGKLLTAIVNRDRCRQYLPSNQYFVVSNTSNNFGGSSQTRTGDTRLFRADQASLRERLTSVNSVMQTRTRTWKLGCVAVKIAVSHTRCE